MVGVNTDHTWEVDALCAGIDPTLWFPAAGEDNLVAKRICLECPVRVRCLETALATESFKGREYRFGIWGGLGPTERANLAGSLSGAGGGLDG